MTVVEKSTTGAKLPLDSLEIKGYRCFKELTIPKLARVNLITGKNNVGKTSLLEAVHLWARRGSPEAVWEILSSREGAFVHAAPTSNDVLDALARIFNSGSSAFARTVYGTSASTYLLSDGELPAAVIGWRSPMGPSKILELKIYRPEPQSVNPIGLFPTFRDNDGIIGHQSQVYSLQRVIDSDRHVWDQKDSTPCLFCGPRGMSAGRNGILWDNIALSPRKVDVIAGLSIIQPVEDVGLFGEPGVGLGRVLYTRLGGDAMPRPLSGLGDGMTRAFGIFLALVNSTDGILLLDEVETGLHYSVLTDVWKTIFELANRLNVQVFATTHSWECIQAFQEALWSSDENDGELIRLESKDDLIKSTVFNKRSVKVVAEDWIEVR